MRSCWTFLLLSVVLVPQVQAQAPCECWIEPDASYHTIDNVTEWDATGSNGPDDGSHGPIPLPFTFDFYGTPVTAVYINVNGNISFGTYNGGYSAEGFPVQTTKMIAPFWADVELDSGGPDTNVVSYKVTPTALYINWSRVGYYQMHDSLLNSFQLIITNGNNPVVPGGNNVSLCYGTMQWTTGDASGGVNGLGGSPATVGANRGNNIDYVQMGRFDHAGTDWDGPDGAGDGVGWLTGRHFLFSTAEAMIPPVFTDVDCDTLDVEVGMPLEQRVLALPGGIGSTLSGEAHCATLQDLGSSFNPLVDAIEIVATITPTVDEVGLHTITYTAQDDAVPPNISTATTTIRVVASTVDVGTASGAGHLFLGPNPADDRTTLTWTAGPPPSLVEVIAMDGALVRSFRPPSQTSIQLDLRGLPAGLYTIRVSSPTGVATGRLVRTNGF